MSPSSRLLCLRGLGQLSGQRLAIGKTGADRIQVGGDFRHSYRLTGAGDHPDYFTVSFPGVKRAEHDLNRTPPTSAEVKESVELNL